MLAGIQIGAVASNSPVDLDKVAAGLVLATLLSLAFGAMALAIAAWSGNRGAAAGIPIGLMVVMYLVQTLSPQIESLRAINPLSLFHYYLGHNALKNGLDLGDAAVLAAVAVGVPGRLAVAVRAARPGGLASANRQPRPRTGR